MSSEMKITLTIMNTGDGFNILKNIFEIISDQCSQDKRKIHEPNGWRKWMIDYMVDDWLIYQLSFEYTTYNEFKVRASIGAGPHIRFLNKLSELFPELTVAAAIISDDSAYQAVGCFSPDLCWHLDSENEFMETDNPFEQRKILLSDDFMDFGKRFTRFPIENDISKSSLIESSCSERDECDEYRGKQVS